MRLSNLAGQQIASRKGSPLRRRARWRWGALVATAIALAVWMWAFQVLVTTVVRNGEQRRLAMAAHSHEMWRCYALHGRLLREACQLELQGPGSGASVSFSVPRSQR